MRSLFAVALLMSSAAAPAAAQVRVGIAVEGPSIGALPVVGMNRRDVSQTSLPSMSLSLSPSLSAPSVSPTLNAVVLPVLAHPSVAVAVQNPLSPSPLLPLSLSAAVTPAASKASDIRAEIGKRRVGKECLRLCRSRWSPYH